MSELGLSNMARVPKPMNLQEINGCLLMSRLLNFRDKGSTSFAYNGPSDINEHHQQTSLLNIRQYITPIT